MGGWSVKMGGWSANMGGWLANMDSLYFFLLQCFFCFLFVDIAVGMLEI